MKLLKWIVGSLLVVAAVALILAPTRSGDVVPEGRRVIRYWEKWTGREGAQMKQIVDLFNDTVGKDRGIFVQYVSMSQISEKTLVSTAAGLPPDVAGLWDTQVAQFAAMDALEPLGERAARYRVADDHSGPDARAMRLTRDYYKHVYWDACTYEGELYALPSTPAAVAMHYNKRLFKERAEALRKAGCDPESYPKTLAELEKYAAALDVWKDGRLVSAGHLPQEPGWWLNQIPAWFGGECYDPATRKLTLTNAPSLAAYTWVASYTDRLGLDEMKKFRAGFPQGFDSPQSPFFAGTVAIVMQGPWTANFIETHNPAMSNRRGLSPEELRKLTREQRRENCDWAAAPFPSAVLGVTDATVTSMDTLVIPRTSKHKDEAFEFIAFVQRQTVMEHLVSMHCKNSPLAKVSPEYIQNHPNPYIEVFEMLASSPNARTLPPVPVWPEVSRELGNAVERVYLKEVTPAQALAEAQRSGQESVDRFFRRQALRKSPATPPASARLEGAATP